MLLLFGQLINRVVREAGVTTAGQRAGVLSGAGGEARRRASRHPATPGHRVAHEPDMQDELRAARLMFWDVHDEVFAKVEACSQPEISFRGLLLFAEQMPRHEQSPPPMWDRAWRPNWLAGTGVPPTAPRSPRARCGYGDHMVRHCRGHQSQWTGSSRGCITPSCTGPGGGVSSSGVRTSPKTRQSGSIAGL